MRLRSERPRRDRNSADAFRAPLHREAFGHRQHRRFRHRGGNREGAAGDSRGREDRKHDAIVLAIDPALAGGECAVHRAMQRRRQDRVRRSERQMLALRDEGRGRIVDEDVERRLTPDCIHHVVDGRTVANVACDGRDLAAGLRAHLRRGCFETVELAAADHELGAECEKAAAPRPEPPPVTRMRLPLSRPVSNIV